jgi:hypothetical protein
MPDEDDFTLRQIDQARGDLYAIQDDLDFIKAQLAQLPTRNEVWRAAMLGGAVAAVSRKPVFKVAPDGEEPGKSQSPASD